ncbi:YjdF family protein [Latilactobacillus curvatus]
MQNVVQSQLTIVFEPPFYQAVFERWYQNQYAVARVNCGTVAPKSAVILDLVMYHWDAIHWYQQLDVDTVQDSRRVNPKRLQRLARKAVVNGTSTKAQLALSRQHEDQHATKRIALRDAKQRNQAERFEQRQAKHREKHRRH